MSASRRPKTATELMAELEQKPEFVERQRQQMAKREENHRLYAEAAAGLLGDLEDEDVAGYAVMGLGKLKAREARAAVEPFVDHGKPWVRKEAKEALAKLGG